MGITGCDREFKGDLVAKALTNRAVASATPSSVLKTQFLLVLI